MTVAAIIQARMGSSRLPGKVLQPMAGEPVLWHIIHRLRKCKTLDVIAVATTTNAQDDTLEAYCKTLDIPVIRGDENNVLQRYVMAAEALNADHVVRVCGDSPLIDPETLDSLVSTLLEQDVDVAYLDSQGHHTIHEGFTAISRRALDAQATYGKDDPAVCEHVTDKLRVYVPNIQIAYAQADTAHYFEGARISVDTPADLTFMETIYARLGAEPGDADITDVVSLLRREPSLLKINHHVRQKTADEISYSVLIRCDGDAQIGMGHVMRSLSLAKYLRDEFSIGVRFAVSAPPRGSTISARNIVERHLFPVEVCPAGADEAGWLNGLLKERQYHGLIFDIRTDLSLAVLESWRNEKYHIVCIDDPSPRRLIAHQNFYPPVPQVLTMDWRDNASDIHHGWEWVLLNPSFSDVAEAPVRPFDMRVVVSMGGADPGDVTSRTIEALQGIDMDARFDIVVGPGFQHRAQLDALQPSLDSRFRLAHNVDNMAAFMAGADVGIAASGVTAYELAASGVPSILTGWTDDHVQSASIFADVGIAVCLGLAQDVSTDDIAIAAKALMETPEKRLEMHKRARELNVISGPRTVAKTIREALEAKK